MQSSTDLIDTLQRYVPALIVRRLANDPRTIAEPSAERLAAVVLFADITDFTALADRISQDEIVGSEELADLLNNCFGRIIDIIHAFGGEVTKFAGDALIALWPLPLDLPRLGSEAESTLSEMARRAAQCSLEIQRAMKGFSTSDGSRIFLQIGIGAGDVYSVHLGGVLDRWEFLLSGTPLVQMSLAKEQALPGHVAVSPEVWELVHKYCVGKPLGEGFVEVITLPYQLVVMPEKSPTLPVEARNGLQSYIPAAILSRLEAGHEEWLSELRRVTVLFIKLPGYGTSIKHPYMRTIPEAQVVMEALQSALYRYAGSINKFNVDDKGITLVAAMGLPPLSHADDAARGVLAAMEIQEALKRLQRRCAIGITTGWVFCGPVGNKQRREYTMVGTVVNMAARLMQAAEERLIQQGTMSEALCDEATFKDIRGLINEPDSLGAKLSFRSVHLSGVKGMKKPITTYRPVKRLGTSHASRSMPCKKIRIAGLRAERDYLAKRLQQVGERSILESSGLVIVEGDSGSGKTQLLTELMYQADKLKLRTLYGFGDPLDQTTPYLAWQTIFQMLFGLDQLFDDHSRLRSHVLSQLPPIEGERGYPAFAIRMSPLLNAVLPLNFPENRTTAQMGENAKQRTTHQFLLRLLERNTAGIGGGKPKPTLLVIEDGHWLDEFSWRLLVDVSQRVKPLLGIVATRRLSEQAMDDRTRRIYRMLDQSDKNIRWINLGYLSPADNLELLQQQLGIDSFPDDAFRILRRKTGGHPLFSLELARYWNATGQIQIKGNQCLMTGQLDELESAPVPNSTQQIITGRLERLSPSHQLLIKTASTLGKTFFVNDLVQIYPVSIDESLITEDLKILEEHKFIVPEDSAEKPSYRFDNEFIHEVALNLLPRQKKMQLAKRLLALKTEL